MTSIFVVLAVVIAVIVIYVLQQVKAYKIPKERCIAFVGSMGSGKTVTAVSICLALTGVINFKEVLKKIIHPIKHKCQWATIYSNIPLKVNCYRPLLPEHITKDRALPENAILLIDEIGGTLADQWSFKSDVLTMMLAEFFRFSRHWFNGYIIVTDQTAGQIPKPVRDRCAKRYHLSNCRTSITLQKKIDITPIMCIDDDVCENQQKTQKPGESFKKEYILVPLKTFKYYESRCYRETYYKGFVFSQEDNICDTPLSTRLYLDIEPDKELVMLAKNDRKELIKRVYGKSIPEGEASAVSCTASPEDTKPM